ncbi:MAG: PAS domain S-box protein, partial [Chthoniobacteraceae bacterium]
MTSPPPVRPVFSRYGFAVLATVAIASMHTTLQHFTGNIPPLQFYTLAVVLAAWWGGFGPGLLATVLCLGALQIFIPPAARGTYLGDTSHLMRIGTFFAIGLAISAIARGLHSAVYREWQKAEALRASEERLRLATEATENIVWDWDVATGRVEWSIAMSERFGWPEALPSTDQTWWQERIHEADRERTLAGIRAVVTDRTQDRWEAEYHFRRGDGSFGEVLDRGRVLRDAGGRAVRMIGATLDLTARRQAEATVRRSREELQAIIDTVPSLISYVDREFIYRWNSRGYERWFGRPLAEITGRPLRELLGDEAFARVRPHIERVLAGESSDFEDYLPYEGIEGRWVHATYSPHQSEDGRVDGTVVTVTDITEHKKAELAQAALAAIVENSDDAIIGKTLDGVVTSWNRAATRLFGYTAEEMIGQKVTRIFPEDRLADEERILATLRRGEGIEHYESQRRTKDGRLIDVAVTISPIHDGSGKVVGASKIVRDITERRRAEAAVLDAAEQRRLALEAADLGAWDYRFKTGEVLGDERFFRMFGVITDKLTYEA